ncbi:hypothetical protein Zmor_009521 [Zophobas morio]|uniref:Uncharacterized protein n=1 Tax=Zophobas morio TaxID=2755281 RepID=A0AA38IJ52_9CUCU|nr:hypothetical protein Zmor_009521 [Zophobas morio]
MGCGDNRTRELTFGETARRLRGRKTEEMRRKWEGRTPLAPAVALLKPVSHPYRLSFSFPSVHVPTASVCTSSAAQGWARWEWYCRWVDSPRG